ncbi:MAG: hypothetical protein CO035_04560, partial [Candidatus Omnitrophica bacterium CG_4_9_14_0_2_um_filter_42_8]
MKSKVILIGLFLALFLPACARAPIKNLPTARHPVMPNTASTNNMLTPGIFRQDVVHEVGPGETVWRISKMYDIPMEDIV